MAKRLSSWLLRAPVMLQSWNRASVLFNFSLHIHKSKAEYSPIFSSCLALTQVHYNTASPKSSNYLEIEWTEPKMNVVSVIIPRFTPKPPTGGSCADNLSILVMRLNESRLKPTLKCSLLNVYSFGNKSLLVNDVVIDSGADLCFFNSNLVQAHRHYSFR